MRSHIILRYVGILLGLLAVSLPALAAGKISVVTTTTDLASLAREVGGDLIETVALAQSSNDPEAFQPRPADVIKLKSAQLAYCGRPPGSAGVATKV